MCRSDKSNFEINNSYQQISQNLIPGNPVRSSRDLVFYPELSSMGFTKLDSGIVQSSIMLEDAETFKAWIVFLAACGPDGIARVSPVYIASICHFDIEKTLTIIKKLESPDPLSRSINDEGRRIERVDGGYRIINYLKYREYTYSDNPESIRKREYRKLGHKRDMSGQSPDILSSASSSNSISSEEDSKEKPKKKREKKEFVPPTIEDVKKYFKEKGYTEQSAVKFFDSYDVNNWYDSRGNQVLNWKMKAIQVWFKDENRISFQKEQNKQSNGFNADTFYGN